MSESKPLEQIILFDSNEAAQRRTVTGWVSHDGFFFGEDERTARYSGCTHRKCEKCQAVIPKTQLKCSNCYTAERAQKFLAMPRELWDTVTPLVLFDGDRYFFDPDDLVNYCEQYEVEIDSLRLVICEPQHLSPLDLCELYQDILPEDGDQYSFDDDVRTALEAVNAAIAKSAPLSWIQGRVAAIIPERLFVPNTHE